MKSIKTSIAALVALSAPLSNLAFAEGGTSYMGVLAGGSGNTGPTANTTPSFGATIGSKLNPYFGLAFFGNYYGNNSTNDHLGLPDGTSTNTVLLAGQANFFVSAFHIGAEFGPAIQSWSGEVSRNHGGTSATSLVYGPQTGIDMELNDEITLGAEIHYLFSSASDVQDSVLGLAAFKWWL